MAFVVLFDANVLYPNVLRDLLLRIAQSGFVQAKWTDEILDEVFRNVRKNRPDLDPGKLDRTRHLMNASVRDCLVVGYEPLIATLDLPDPDDRHVLAAAIKAQARVIVTENLRDFPGRALGPWNVEAQTSDDFVLDRIELCERVVVEAVRRIVDSRRAPPTSVSEVLDALERCGLRKSVAALRSGQE
ncbi:PIN domain-containing protein [Amycolatopsis keratiniphila subsp. nogabecina]|nr:PIN domain-containing protein [Amycolatopsis keratiniphila subsp. nogabecina]SDU58283.1 Predicted nucleic acid-binding protein, contains PIN domain [Amycolatopsis keratiniphila]